MLRCMPSLQSEKRIPLLRRRFSFVLLAMALAAIGVAAGAASSAPIPVLRTATLQVSDVQAIIANAVTRAVHDSAPVVIAVSDREGNVLGVFNMTGAAAVSQDFDSPINDDFSAFPPAPPTTQSIAIQKARTAEFLSSDQKA